MLLYQSDAIDDSRSDGIPPGPKNGCQTPLAVLNVDARTERESLFLYITSHTVTKYRVPLAGRLPQNFAFHQPCDYVMPLNIGTVLISCSASLLCNYCCHTSERCFPCGRPDTSSAFPCQKKFPGICPHDSPLSSFKLRHT